PTPATSTLSLPDALPILRDKAVKAKAAVVARQVDLRARLTKVFDAGRQLGGAHAVGEGHMPHRAPGRLPAVAALSKQLPGEDFRDRKSTRLNSSHVAISY